MIRLYYNVDDSNDNDGEYLDSQDDEIVFREDIPPFFASSHITKRHLQNHRLLSSSPLTP